MKPTSDQVTYSKYTFHEKTGYVVAPWIPGMSHEWIAIRHSASVPPWVDGDVHLHTDAEEYFFVFQGELRLLIDEAVFTLMQGTRVLQLKEDLVEVRAGETLEVPPRTKRVSQATRMPFQRFTFRVPTLDDKLKS